MKRFLCVWLALLLQCLPLQAVAASADETTGQNWYFKPAGNRQPQLLGGSELTKKYGVLALGSDAEKVLYLTFDAGYENGNVARVLDVLQKHNAVGAFFILPGLIKNSPETVKRMANEGHTVCNHSTTHKDLSRLTDRASLERELNGVATQYEQLTGCRMAPYFRPPEGRFSERLLQLCAELGYSAVFWSYAYADWDNAKQPDPQAAKQKLLSNLHPGEVLLLHPTSQTNADILDEFLTEAEARGYRFGALDELREQKANGTNPRANSSVLRENPNAGKVLALTFDDGPHPSQTDEILAVLQKYNVRATFFPIGQNLALYPEVERRVREAGHEIGNHTYTHANVTKLTSDKLEQELSQTEQLLVRQVGCKPVVFRPPGGAINDSAVALAERMGYRCVLWSWELDTRDWEAIPPSSVVKTVLSHAKPGGIVLFHDYVVGAGPTAAALEVILPALIEQGYTFVTVSELAEAS